MFCVEYFTLFNINKNILTTNNYIIKIKKGIKLTPYLLILLINSDNLVILLSRPLTSFSFLLSDISNLS